MGSKNAISKTYLSDRKRFADICNNQLFGSRQVIRPELLRELDTEEFLVEGNHRKKLSTLEKYRDILRIYDDQVMFMILGIENQSEVHYAMPLRQLLYDVLNYENQRMELEREHREKKDLKGAAYLSGISKEDRLIPVITLVIYWGCDPWSGAKTLHEMLDIPPVLAQYKDIINDYRMNLLEVNSMDNLESYRGELKALLGFIRYQKDKEELRRFIDENTGIFQGMTEETARAISVLGNVPELERFLDTNVEHEYNREAIDMCQALKEMIEDGRAEGKAEGKAESILELLQDLGEVPETLSAKILVQQNLEVLKEWLKIAARSDSIEEFAQKIQ